MTDKQVQCPFCDKQYKTDVGLKSHLAHKHDLEGKEEMIGRPTKYKPEYCAQIEEFFKVPPYREDVDYKGEYKAIPNDLPTFETFASILDVNTDTLLEWSKVHKQFSASYKKSKQLQKNFILQNGLRNLYHGSFAIFTAKNITDMRDQKNVDVTSSGKPIPLMNINPDVSTDNSDE